MPRFMLGIIGLGLIGLGASICTGWADGWAGLRPFRRDSDRSRDRDPWLLGVLQRQQGL